MDKANDRSSSAKGDTVGPREETEASGQAAGCTTACFGRATNMQSSSNLNRKEDSDQKGVFRSAHNPGRMASSRVGCKRGGQELDGMVRGRRGTSV